MRMQTHANRHQAKHRFIAWLLLVLFMMPIVVKAVHVCQLDDLSASNTTKAKCHNADTCAVCHFFFTTFDKPALIHLEGMLVMTVVCLIFFFQTGHTIQEVATRSLRAPPYQL